MIQRTLTTLILILIIFALTGNAKGQDAWNPSTYAVVDSSAGEWDKLTFATIQGAIDAGATWIDVRPGEYAGFVLSRPNVTVNMQGARFHNTNNVTIWIEAGAEGAALQGDYEIYGDADGTVMGDFYSGVGVHNTAAYTTIDGIKCTNLLSFCVLSPAATAHHGVIRDCLIRNVATTPAPQKLASKGILLTNGSSYNEVTGCDISGQSQAIGTWYGASYNRVYGNSLVNNYGWIGVNMPRSAIENYGLPGAVNIGNEFTDNYIDGSNASAFELADSLEDTVVRGNDVRNTVVGFWMGGSGDNKSLNVTIADNVFHGHAGMQSNWFSGSGKVVGNIFYDYTATGGTGTIYVHSGSLGELEVIGNTFEGGDTVIRYNAENGDLLFKDNTITTDADTERIIYFSDITNGGHVIEGNTITALNVNFTISANRNTQVTARNNTLYGGAIWSLGDNSVIEGNTVYCSPGAWTGLATGGTGIVVRNNRLYCDNTPFAIWDATNGLIERNFVAKNDGSAATMPPCGANTCIRNWTTGQVPPP